MSAARSHRRPDWIRVLPSWRRLRPQMQLERRGSIPATAVRVVAAKNLHQCGVAATCGRKPMPSAFFGCFHLSERKKHGIVNATLNNALEGGTAACFYCAMSTILIEVRRAKVS